MIDFFKHKKFWLPLVIIGLGTIILELILRAGFYDPILNVNSHLGNSINRVNQMQAFDDSKIHWITLGDSKTDWGLNHKKLRKHQSKLGINHIRMSLGGASYLTVQAAAEWSIDHLPNLDGIMLGMYENEFLNLGNETKEYKISWPFRAYWAPDKFDYFRQETTWHRWVNNFALTQYFPDIKQFLLHPYSRIKAIKKAHQYNTNVFDFHRKSINGHMCDFNLSDLNHCVNNFSHIKTRSLVPKNYHIPYNYCTTRKAKSRLRNNQFHTARILTDEFEIKWRYLFDKILTQNKQLTLVLLPEHSFFDYMVKPANSSEFIDGLLEKYQNNKHFKVIDLRRLFDQTNECQFYSDVLHFNLEGISKVTDAIISNID